MSYTILKTTRNDVLLIIFFPNFIRYGDRRNENRFGNRSFWKPFWLCRQILSLKFVQFSTGPVVAIRDWWSLTREIVASKASRHPRGLVGRPKNAFRTSKPVGTNKVRLRVTSGHSQCVVPRQNPFLFPVVWCKHGNRTSPLRFVFTYFSHWGVAKFYCRPLTFSGNRPPRLSSRACKQ